LKVTVDMVGRGVKDGLRTTWELAKVIIPVYFLITVLKYTPLMDLMVKAFEPVTKLVGLPGEAALPIVIANLLTIYPAIPAIIAFPFTPKEITIISTMILLCHSLLVEGAIAKKAGTTAWKVVVLRICTALTAGIILNLVL
jgi:hypothetical protein